MGTPETDRNIANKIGRGVHGGVLPSMPKRDWYAHIAIAGWGVAIILGCLMWADIVAVRPSVGLAQKTVQSKPTQQPKPDAAQNHSRGPAKEDRQAVTKELECADKNEATYNDCLIQLRTTRAAERQADYVKYSAYISAVALFFAAVAAVAAIAAAIYAASAATAAHAGAEQTALAAQAAVRSADIAERSAAETARFAATSAAASAKSADVAERALRGLERPYLFIERIETEGLKWRLAQSDTRPSIRFSVVNFGKTPAILRSLCVRLQAAPDFPLRLPMARAKRYFTVVEPGRRLAHRKGDDFGQVEVEDSEKGATIFGTEMARLVFHGVIQYEDPTGAFHTDRFCLRGNRDGDSFTLEGGATYNWRKTTYPEEQRDETDT
jgi:hypothetical protein